MDGTTTTTVMVLQSYTKFFFKKKWMEYYFTFTAMEPGGVFPNTPCSIGYRFSRPDSYCSLNWKKNTNQLVHCNSVMRLDISQNFLDRWILLKEKEINLVFMCFSKVFNFSQLQMYS